MLYSSSCLNRIKFKFSPSDDLASVTKKLKKAFYSDGTQMWYTDTFLSGTGFHLMEHAHGFNVSRRSLFVRSGRVRVLLLRFEDIRYWDSILQKYFPDSAHNMTQVREHHGTAENKKIAVQYQNMQAKIVFTAAEIAATNASDTFRFYSQCERSAMAHAARSPATYSICRATKSGNEVGVLCNVEQKASERQGKGA